MDENELLDFLEKQNALLASDARAVSFRRNYNNQRSKYEARLDGSSSPTRVQASPCNSSDNIFCVSDNSKDILSPISHLRENKSLANNATSNNAQRNYKRESPLIHPSDLSVSCDCSSRKAKIEPHARGFRSHSDSDIQQPVEDLHTNISMHHNSTENCSTCSDGAISVCTNFKVINSKSCSGSTGPVTKQESDLIDDLHIREGLKYSHEDSLGITDDPKAITATLQDTEIGNSDPDEETLNQWTDILANWKVWYKRKQRRLLDLLYSGVPKALRCVVWQQLGRSYQLADESQTQSLVADTTEVPSYAELISRTSPHEKSIRQDLARTFPSHTKFQDREGMGQEVLYNVMKAYSLYDTEVGYCQGSAFIVAILLMHMPEEEAFEMFIILMYNYKLRGMFKPSMADLPLRLFQLENLTNNLLPDLHCHLQELGVTPSMYASQWFLTAFTTSLHTAAAFRLFDVLLLEGIPFLFKVGLAILQTNRKTLVRHNFEGVMFYLSRNALQQRYEDRENELLSAARATLVSAKQLLRLERQYSADLKEKQTRTSEVILLREKNAELKEMNGALQSQVWNF